MARSIDIAVGFRGGLISILIGLALVLISGPADAFKIEKVTSPGGIEAWLVSEHSIPMIAINFAFRAGAALDNSVLGFYIDPRTFSLSVGYRF